MWQIGNGGEIWKSVKLFCVLKERKKQTNQNNKSHHIFLFLLKEEEIAHFQKVFELMCTLAVYGLIGISPEAFIQVLVE